MRKLTLVTALAVILAIAIASVAAAHPFDRDDDGWRTYVVGPGAIPVPPPPRNHSAQTRAELATLEADQAARDASPAIQAQIAKWDAQPAFAPWTKKTLALISANATSTAKAQRVMALVHVAMNDATVARVALQAALSPPEPGAAGPRAAAVGGGRRRALIPVGARRPRGRGGRGPEGPVPGRRHDRERRAGGRRLAAVRGHQLPQ